MTSGALSRLSVSNRVLKASLSAGIAIWLCLAGGVLGTAQTVVNRPPAIFDVRRFGARCNWNGSAGADDTPAFQAAAKAASRAYQSSGRAKTVTFYGNCVVSGEVTYGSGVHWLGHGTIFVPHQTGFTLHAVNADDVAWDRVNITVLKPGTSGPTASAISWFSVDDPHSQHKVAIRNCTLKNSDWGILIAYNNGSGSLDDVEIASNTVTSDVLYTNGDGIHVSGRVSGIRIHDNRIVNRGDAGIGLTSESAGIPGRPTYVLSGANVWNNVLTDDLVGLDDSGATHVDWTGNTVKATVAKKSAQNPAFRQIWYGDTYPVAVRTMHNYFASGDNGGVSPTVKIDPKVTGQTSWPDLQTLFEDNVIDGPNAPLYVRGRGIGIAGNTFARGGTFTVDYDGAGGVATTDIVLGPNTWMRAGALVAGAGCALYKNVSVAPQLSRETLTYKHRECLQAVTQNRTSKNH